MITVPFLIEWAVRSAILIASTAALLNLLRSQDPAVRLAVWTAVLFSSLALPLVHRTAPAIPVAAPVAGALPPAVAAEIAPLILAAETAPAEPAPIRFDWSRAAVAIYLAGAGLILLRMAIGLLLGWRILRRSRRTERAGIRESAELGSPAVLGILRPAIVLPEGWREWDAGKLAAVLAHERSHIRRRDPAVQLLAAVHRAVLWFSPPAWYLERQIIRLAEEASDDAAIAAIEDRVSYAEVLLDFLRGARPAKWQGVPMARYAQPEWRIDRILDGAFLSRGVTRWSAAAIVALAAPAAYLIAAAQATEPSPKFEVASVKQHVLAPGMHAFGTTSRESALLISGNRVTTSGRIDGLVMAAYKLRTFQVSAVPELAEEVLHGQIYDIEARAPGDGVVSMDQARLMLRTLLADRFQLKFHHEAKETAAYDLTVASTPPKLKASASDTPSHTENLLASGWLFHTRYTNVSISELVLRLSPLSDRPLIDKTGLTGGYDFELQYAPPPPDTSKWSPEEVAALARAAPHQEGPPLIAALQQQLGLKVVQAKEPVELLVIDHVEKPTDN